MNKKDYNRKLKVYKILGAEKFQEVVFAVERLKYRFLKKCWPNFINHFDKYCDYKQRKALKRAKTDEERKTIIRSVKLSKMAMRKELNTEKNRNYHMDKNKPTEIIQYLEWNKKVHKGGLIKDIVMIPILIGLTISGYGIAIPLLIMGLISAGINFECINIQNYNLCRIKPLEKQLKKREQHITEKNIESYGQAAEVIHKSIEKSESLPTIDEIIANIDNKEQLKQMIELLRKKQNERQSDIENQKIRGKVK